MKIRKLLPVAAASILFYSCSLSKKINRSASTDLFSLPSFAHAHTGISIFEPATGKYWYNYQAEKYFTPASNTKLATCYAAMKYLGDSLAGLRYEEINDSTVVIQGIGDPSFLHPDFKINPVYHFLKKYKVVLLMPQTFDKYLGPGWGWNDYMEDYMAQRSELPMYGNIMKIMLAADNKLTILPKYFINHCTIADSLTTGFSVNKLWEFNDFIIRDGHEKKAEIPFTPNQKTVLFLLHDTLGVETAIIKGYTKQLREIIYSQPTDSLLKPMMHRSDNFFAEQSLLMVSEKLLGEMDDEKIIDTLLKSDYAPMPQKPSWVDGSGLSRYDLFSPLDFVFILNKMKNDFGMDRIKNILPTGGTGTISNYYRQDSGYIFAKTGTLNGVVALSGFLYTRKNKLLIFSVLVNNHRGSATEIRKGIEKFLQTLCDKH